MDCKKLLDNEIKYFKNQSGFYYVPCKPTLEQELPQLKYNACTDAYGHKDITKQDIINFFGIDLYNEVALCAYEQEQDL